MTGIELSVAADAALIKIHAMTGWNFPDPTVASILKDQFEKKMQETYANVNLDEVEYAFRTFGTQVKDWGKSMNLSLIDEVMIPYMEQRASVSKYEENKKPPQIEHKEDLSDKAMSEWWEEIKVRVKSGMHFSLMPVMLYDWMDKRGEINLDAKTKYGYMDAAAKYLVSEGVEPLEEKVKDMAKKMILFDKILKEA